MTTNQPITNRINLLQSFEKLQAQFAQALDEAQAKDSEFEQLRQDFHNKLIHRLKEAGQKLPEKNPLAQEIATFIDFLNTINTKWNEKIASRDKGVRFRKGFDDSLLVFVYGKVKSGKSSLGNYIAWGHTDPNTVPNLKTSATLLPNYFSHERTNAASGDAHQEAEQKQEFRVGATEATSSIQGFYLSGLTWVDSPGLHSTNEENGRLARDYVDHADLILYTMKSDAPGRETDLAEIRELLRKDKKILLLLTGSDTTEEDEDEQGNIVQATVMKPADNRAKQCQYVREALNKELKNTDTKNIDIISFSARYAQEHEHEPALFWDSGMGQFFAILSELVHAEGVAVKKRVPMNNFKNFVSDCISDIAPYRDLLAGFEKTLADLQQKLPKTFEAAQSGAVRDVLQTVNREFDAINGLDNEGKQKGIQAAQKRLNQKCQDIAKQYLTNVFAEIISDFHDTISRDITESDLIKLPEFAVEMQEQKIAKGVISGTKNRNSGIGTLVGLAGGWFLGGPAGAMVGGLLGGLLGNASGDEASVRYETVCLPVSDNLEDIRHSAQKAYPNAVKQQMAQSTEKLLNQVLQEAKKLLQDLSDEVQDMECKLQNLHDEVAKVLSRI